MVLLPEFQSVSVETCFSRFSLLTRKSLEFSCTSSQVDRKHWKQIDGVIYIWFDYNWLKLNSYRAVISWNDNAFTMQTPALPNVRYRRPESRLDHNEYHKKAWYIYQTVQWMPSHGHARDRQIMNWVVPAVLDQGISFVTDASNKWTRTKHALCQ